MALNAATDQQYHLLDQDGTADDQMDQLQGDHDTISECAPAEPIRKSKQIPCENEKCLMRITHQGCNKLRHVGIKAQNQLRHIRKACFQPNLNCLPCRDAPDLLSNLPVCALIAPCFQRTSVYQGPEVTT
ncbi:hypothetical protein MRX96_042987 [Rhipicephalus microplus]